MPSFNNRQLIKGMILLSSILLIAACAEPEPYAVVYESEQPTEVNTVQATIPETEPEPEPEPEPIAQVTEPVEPVVYEEQFPETYIVQ
jgi:hypothetical protein